MKTNASATSPNAALKTAIASCCPTEYAAIVALDATPASAETSSACCTPAPCGVSGIRLDATCTAITVSTMSTDESMLNASSISQMLARRKTQRDELRQRGAAQVELARSRSSVTPCRTLAQKSRTRTDRYGEQREQQDRHQRHEEDREARMLREEREVEGVELREIRDLRKDALRESVDQDQHADAHVERQLDHERRADRRVVGVRAPCACPDTAARPLRRAPG